jgi:hypothetical protein
MHARLLMFSNMRSKHALASLYNTAPGSRCSLHISCVMTVLVAISTELRPMRPPACSGATV